MAVGRFEPASNSIARSAIGLAAAMGPRRRCCIGGSPHEAQGDPDHDFFWPRVAVSGEIAESAERCLEQARLSAEWIQKEPSFARLRVSDGDEVVVLELVAEPRDFLEPATDVKVGKARIHVESRHEILVEKLCTLLGRSEIRDLEDVRVLLDSGADLERALKDAPRKDTGFSPLTLAWVLRGMDLAALADLSGWDAESAARLAPFRDSLVRRITDLAEPR